MEAHAERGGRTDSPLDHTGQTSTSVASAFAHRWPSALALIAAILIWPSGAEQTVRILAEVLFILPLIYLVTAATGRQGAVWIVFATLGAAFVLIGLQDWVPIFIGLSAVAIAALVWSAVRKRLDASMWVQAAGVLAFGATAVAAQYVDLDIARYLVAAGWLAHALWDFAHHRANWAVAQSFAEYCAVLDVLVSLAVLLVPK